MENYKLINKQLIEQNREMRIRLGQEREQSAYLCTKLIEERAMRVELQQKMQELHVKFFNMAINTICPDANVLDVLNMNNREDSNGNTTTTTTTTIRNTIHRSSTSARSSGERRQSGSSGSQRSSLGRFSSNIDVPLSPTRRRYSVGRSGLRLSEELSADPNESLEEEELEIDTDKELTPRKCSFPEEEEDDIDETEQYAPYTPQQEEEDALEEDDGDDIEWETSVLQDTDVENEETVQTPPIVQKTLAKSKSKRTTKEICAPFKTASPLRDLTNRRVAKENVVTRTRKNQKQPEEENTSCVNETLPQVRLESSPASRKVAKQRCMLEPLLPADESAGQTLCGDSYSISNLDMKNMLCSTPNSSRLSATSFCAHLEHVQQPSTIQPGNATPDYECSTLSLTSRPRRNCTPTNFREPNLQVKMRGEELKVKNKSKTKKKKK